MWFTIVGVLFVFNVYFLRLGLCVLVVVCLVLVWFSCYGLKVGENGPV